MSTRIDIMGDTMDTRSAVTLNKGTNSSELLANRIFTA